MGLIRNLSKGRQAHWRSLPLRKGFGKIRGGGRLMVERGGGQRCGRSEGERRREPEGVESAAEIMGQHWSPPEVPNVQLLQIKYCSPKICPYH